MTSLPWPEHEFELNREESPERYNNVVDHLVKKCPVIHNTTDGEGYWLINQYADVRAGVQDWETYSSATGVMANRPAEMPILIPTESDPPFHTNLRTVLNPFLAPKAVAKLEPSVRRIAGEIIDSFIGEGEVEVVSEFGNMLPARVWCECFAGMPPSDMPYLQHNFQLMMNALPYEERARATDRILEYVATYMDKRLEEPPRGDIVDAIHSFDFEGEGKDSSAKYYVFLQLTQGGLGTTSGILTAGLYYLAKHPADRRALIDEPALIPAAIEEFLRFHGSVAQEGRRVTRDVEVGGKVIPKGDFVVNNFGAANRDPSIFTEPDKVNIKRRPNPHLAFGGGAHRCIGSNLARLNLRVAFEEFLAKVPDFELTDPEFEPTLMISMTMDWESLPLSFRAASAR